MTEKKEPTYCIECGKEQTAKDMRIGCGRNEPQCQRCGNLLLTQTPVRCLSTGCRGEKLFLPLAFSPPDFERTTECPLCGQSGQFTEVEN